MKLQNKLQLANELKQILPKSFIITTTLQVSKSSNKFYPNNRIWYDGMERNGFSGEGKTLQEAKLKFLELAKEKGIIPQDYTGE